MFTEFQQITVCENNFVFIAINETFLGLILHVHWPYGYEEWDCKSDSEIVIIISPNFGTFQWQMKFNWLIARKPNKNNEFLSTYQLWCFF